MTADEYIPTTDEIVGYYLDGSRDWFPGLTASERGERFYRWLAGERARVLREAVRDMRMAWEGSWNLRDPRDPEVAYSVDRWLEVRADRIERGGAG